MYSLKNTKLWKPFLFILLASLVMVLSAGMAMAAGLDPDPGPLPDPDPGIVKPYVVVSDIEFKVGEDFVFGQITVVNQSNQLVAGAEVVASWTFPDGSEQKLTGMTGKNGRVSFTMEKVTGVHKVEVHDVYFTFPFNPDASQLIGTVTVGD